MKNLDDDVYSFGYIILESIVGPSVSAKKESFMLNDMVISSSTLQSLDNNEIYLHSGLSEGMCEFKYLSLTITRKTTKIHKK